MQSRTDREQFSSNKSFKLIDDNMSKSTIQDIACVYWCKVVVVVAVVIVVGRVRFRSEMARTDVKTK